MLNTAQEFEPHAFHDGAFWTCDVSIHQQYPWTRDHCKDDDCSSHEQRQNPRGVSFNNAVSVRCISEDSCYEADFHIEKIHEQLRLFWHLDGQIANGSDIFATLKVLQHTGEVENLRQGSTSEMHKVTADKADQSHVTEDFASTAHANLWWNDLIENKFPGQDRRPVFVSTWYLAPGRFHLCIRCRRVRIHAEMSADDFERACRSAWHELDTGQHLNIFLVDGTPPGLPSTIANVILIQGHMESFNSVLMHGNLLPPLLSTRAVLFPSDGTVSQLFQHAQFPEACGVRGFSCSVIFQNDGEWQRLFNDDFLDVTIAKFVQGSMIHNADMEQRAVSDSITDASTDTPDSDIEDDASSLIGVEINTESDGEDFGSSSFQFEHPGHRWTWEVWQSCDCEDNDATDSCGRSSNQCDCDFSHGDPKPVFGDDISSLMSSHPHIFQFNEVGPLPWVEFANNQDEDEDFQEEGISISFADQHQELSQAHIDLIRADLAAEELDDMWTAVTFGLGLIDLGRRDVAFHPTDLDQLLRRILDLWEDHAHYGDLTIYHVDPQPMDIAGEKSIVLIVAVDMEDARDHQARNVLVHERAVEGVTTRPAHYAARLFAPATRDEILVTLGLHHQCPPLSTRDCGVRLGMHSIDPLQQYDFAHGTLCLTWIGSRPEAVTSAIQTIYNVEEFFLQINRLQHFQPDRQKITLAVHGVTPANRPLGTRDVVLELENLNDLHWIDWIKQLWPFANEACTISFVSDLTADMQDTGFERFNFIASYGEDFDPAIIIHQHFDIVENLPGGATIDEFWAIRMPPARISHSLPGIAMDSPFWFRSARARSVYPHLSIEGQRARDVHRSWTHGDLLLVKYNVWLRYHALAIMLNEDSHEVPDSVPEETSFLQTNWRLSQSIDSAFHEVCHAIATAQDEEVQCATEFHEQTVRIIVQHPCDEDILTSTKECKTDDCLDSLQSALDEILGTQWSGLNMDFSILPPLHPYAQVACQITPQREDSNIFHIFTDGSSHQHSSAWAFVLLCEIHSPFGRSFARVGFAADIVDQSIGAVSSHAVDAEATALVAAAEYLLGLSHLNNLEIHLHYDALAVGHGAVGFSKIVEMKSHDTHRQKAARILVHLVQIKSKRLMNFHVHAHSGHPWNEFADSIAVLVRKGWTPQCKAHLRSGSLVNHELAEWAWLLLNPSEELPDLRTILANAKPEPFVNWTDPTLQIEPHRQQHHGCFKTLKIATVNVGTLHYDSTDEVVSTTLKAQELMHQFAHESLHWIALQETRAKHSCTTRNGSFVCLKSAAYSGQGGLELWFNVGAIFRDFGINFDPNHDACVWHSSHRILACRCQLGTFAIEIFVCYAPQRGRENDEIRAWWTEFEEVFNKRDRAACSFIMGDLNCRIGEIETSAIGSANWDFEDTGGGCLRHLCNHHDMFIPSTFEHHHQDLGVTFVSRLGHKSRLDYIVIDAECKQSVLKSYVNMEVDLLNGDCDHKLLCLELQILCGKTIEGSLQRKPLYNRDLARKAEDNRQLQILETAPICQWNVDVNTHWGILRNHLQQEVGARFPCQKRKPRQQYFNSRTCELLCYRKELRKEHRALQRTQAMSQLAQVFHAWRRGWVEEDSVIEQSRIDHLNHMQEALLLQMRISIDRQFRCIKKHDWKQWINFQMENSVEKMKHATASELFKILKPKTMLSQRKGTSRRPLPGLRSKDGQWCRSRHQIALAWEKQFAEIEHAEALNFDSLIERSRASEGALSAKVLTSIPSVFDLEKSIMELKDNKAPGLDGLGAEIWQGQPIAVAKKIFPVMLKAAIRRQHVVEWTGGWLLPLHKKGPPTLMQNYRAILLEPTIARAVSKSWRKYLVAGLEHISVPLQHGGRKGIGIEPIHMILQFWQANSRAAKKSLGIVFVDIQAAFYSIFKPLLVRFDGTLDSLISIFHELQLPASALQSFLENIDQADIVHQATTSELAVGHVRASLAHTWFSIPGADHVQAPRTGTRPGDPSADILFSMVLSRVMEQVYDKAHRANIPLQVEDQFGSETRCIAWVDDLALCTIDTAENIASSTAVLLSIVTDVLIEHGLRTSIGKGKTAVLLDFHGPHAHKSKQQFEQRQGDVLPVLTEHFGSTSIPVVGRYKHLGGIVVPGGAKLTEIRRRGMLVQQNVAPLKALLAQPKIDISHRRILLRSLGTSVARLHCGTWFDLTKGEVDAWHSVVFKLYQLLESRDAQGNVPHRDLYELAHQAQSPMPMEFLYIERFRLLIHVIAAADKYVIQAILHNFRLAQTRSWLYGAIKAVKWAQSQIGRECIPDELLNLSDVATWTDFRDAVPELKRMLRKVHNAQLLRLQTYCALKEQATFQHELFLEMGWERQEDLSSDAIFPSTVKDAQAICQMCHACFDTQAALAVHQQRKHGARMALRRFVKDGTCRSCKKHFHNRTRLLRHLHWGQTNCWIYHFRSFVPMTESEATWMDETDRDNMVAFHQQHIAGDFVKRTWRPALDFELEPCLSLQDRSDDPWKEPSAEELECWKEVGLLPPGKGGRARTSRSMKDWQLKNVCRDTSELEQSLLQDISLWKADLAWIPRPLSRGEKFFLVLFSGHRRLGDICSWFHWNSDITPVAIDVAVHKTHGDLMQHGLWQQLIRARRVTGAHGAPPCETYSCARWIELADQVGPRPLRDKEMPWGRDFLMPHELRQCVNGSILMFITIRLLLLVFAHGGSISLEHPRGNAQSTVQWSIWMSSLIKWILLGTALDTVTFLQGPLGQCAPKPTTLLHGRLGSIASNIFSKYDLAWRPTMYLGGKDEHGWRTAHAKVYPWRLSQAIAESHMAHAQDLKTEGHDDVNEEVTVAIRALSEIFDPYDPASFRHMMRGDYHRGRP